MQHSTSTTALIGSSELTAIVPYSINHIRRLENAGTFPKRVRIGTNRVGWVRAEVEQWLNDRLGGR
jgi:prophage regulatory protein